MKMISDNSVFRVDGIMPCQRFGSWGIGDGFSVNCKACGQHLHRVLTILYSEHLGPFSVVPLRH